MTVGLTLWSAELSDAERVALDPGPASEFNRTPDILIVGGGVLGVATALACTRDRLGSVVLLEKATLAAGASGGAAGQLLPESHIGIDPPALVELGRGGLAGWRALHRTLPGGVGLLDLQWLGIGPGIARFDKTEPINGVRLTAEDVADLIPGLLEPTAGILVRDQARVNPRRAIARLVGALPRSTAQVATRVEVRGVTQHGDRVTTVHTSHGDFTPGNVIFAMGLSPRLAGLDFELPSHFVKGHIVVSEPAPVRLPGAVDTLGTSLDDGRLLIGGSLDLGDDEWVVRPEILASEWSATVAAWPPVAGVRVEFGWACFRPAHPDLLPVIDRVPGLANAWVTSGHYRTGILMAPATADVLATWISSGIAPPGIHAFCAGRF